MYGINIANNSTCKELAQSDHLFSNKRSRKKLQFQSTIS